MKTQTLIHSPDQRKILARMDDFLYSPINNAITIEKLEQTFKVITINDVYDFSGCLVRHIYLID